MKRASRAKTSLSVIRTWKLAPHDGVTLRDGERYRKRWDRQKEHKKRR